jgi:hypothetical protein
MKISGLLTQKKTSPPPKVGEVKRFTVEARPKKSGVGTWNKLINAKDSQGAFYEVFAVEATDYEDDYGNVSYSLGVELIPTATSPVPTPTQGPAPVFRTGQDSVRQHLMRSANLYCMCVNAVTAVIMPHLGSEMSDEDFRSAVHTLFIEASKKEKPGEPWISWIDQMPDKPMNPDTGEEEDPF